LASTAEARGDVGAEARGGDSVRRVPWPRLRGHADALQALAEVESSEPTDGLLIGLLRTGSPRRTTRIALEVDVDVLQEVQGRPLTADV
jgi:hypothetical protein